MEDRILTELYRRSFAASEPPGDWDRLLEIAPLNDEGRKVIPYMDYECEEGVLEEIFKDVMKEYKIPKWKQKRFYFSFMLGCSPKTKRK